MKFKNIIQHEKMLQPMQTDKRAYGSDAEISRSLTSESQ